MRLAVAAALLQACATGFNAPAHRRALAPRAADAQGSFSEPRGGRGGGRGRGRGRGRGGGRGRGRQGDFEKRPGDWDCPKCRVNNFASRRQCFRCGAEGPKRPPGQNRRRPNQFSWMEATKESGGPKAVVDALPGRVWWLNPDAITEKEVAAIARERGLDPADVDVATLVAAAASTYSLADDNFSTPGFNPVVKDLGMVDPETYEPLADDPWCGDEPPLAASED
jgi:hypothetical protein